MRSKGTRVEIEGQRWRMEMERGSDGRREGKVLSAGSEGALAREREWVKASSASARDSPGRWFSTATGASSAR
eukprot:5756174-Pleurochrysis_carterae.AAC.3